MTYDIIVKAKAAGHIVENRCNWLTSNGLLRSDRVSNTMIYRRRQANEVAA